MEITSPYFYPFALPTSACGTAPVPLPMNPEKSVVDKSLKKRKIKTEPEDENEATSTMLVPLKKVKQEKITEHMVVKKKRDRFNGMTEEEVMQRTLPDHLAPNLDIVVIGFNPGLTAAYVGHHYAGPGNHFWKCLHLSKIIAEPMTAYDDYKLLKHGIGFTNIVNRTTKGSGDLTKKEIQDGGKILLEKLKFYHPKIAVFNGKGIYEIFSGNKHFIFGKQPEPLDGTDTMVFVMPSSSARCSQLPRAVDKVPFYVALKKLRDYLRGDQKVLNEAEVCFPDLELKVKTDKSEKRENQNNKHQKPPQNAWPTCNQPLPPSSFDFSSQSCFIQPQAHGVKQEPFYNPEDYGRMPGQNFDCTAGTFAAHPPAIFHNLHKDGLSPQATPNSAAMTAAMSQYCAAYPQPPYGYMPFPT